MEEHEDEDMLEILHRISLSEDDLEWELALIEHPEWFADELAYDPEDLGILPFLAPCRLGFFLCDGGEGSFPTFTMPLSRQIIICCLFISLAPSEIHMLDPTITCGLVLNESEETPLYFYFRSKVSFDAVYCWNPSMVPSSFFHSLSWSAKADVRTKSAGAGGHNSLIAFFNDHTAYVNFPNNVIVI
ncbi:hypothetical protein RhiirC2_794914 [Rhizophagus irregularis]|uniref:Uncharacterized protein n=1 Tax=Rhizophagus irregularis TaxID=588596 RepID=A0A2N1MCK9_9GLOM|nr:hypothetical protein RhiirC2_794914 [Rhizophagus irregularis]